MNSFAEKVYFFYKREMWFQLVSGQDPSNWYPGWGKILPIGIRAGARSIQLVSGLGQDPSNWELVLHREGMTIEKNQRIGKNQK